MKSTSTIPTPTPLPLLVKNLALLPSTWYKFTIHMGKGIITHDLHTLCTAQCGHDFGSFDLQRKCDVAKASKIYNSNLFTEYLLSKIYTR